MKSFTLLNVLCFTCISALAQEADTKIYNKKFYAIPDPEIPGVYHICPDSTKKIEKMKRIEIPLMDRFDKKNGIVYLDTTGQKILKWKPNDNIDYKIKIVPPVEIKVDTLLWKDKLYSPELKKY